MSESDVRFVGDVLITGARRLELEHAIDAAWRAGSRIIVLFDPDAEQGKIGQFPNLVAVNERGEQVWIADLPTSTTGDRYYRVQSEDPIVVSSVSSYDCEIDLGTGRIVRQEFTK